MNEINGLHIAVLIVSGLAVLLLLIYLIGSGKKSSSARKVPSPENGETETVKRRPCPLCGELLKKGETVHSVLYPGKPDSIMEIYGCPFCDTKPKGGESETKTSGHRNTRTCPVCKKVMPDDSLLIARVYEKPGKKHVHVLGCSVCYSGRSIPKKDS